MLSCSIYLIREDFFFDRLEVRGPVACVGRVESPMIGKGFGLQRMLSPRGDESVRISIVESSLGAAPSEVDVLSTERPTSPSEEGMAPSEREISPSEDLLMLERED